MKSKKAQFYIFAVVVLCSMLLFLLPAPALQADESSRTLFVSYSTESAKAANAAIFSGAGYLDTINDFNKRFAEFAGGRSFSVLYIAGENGNVTIINNLNSSVQINHEVIVEAGASLVLSDAEDITVTYLGRDYMFSIQNPRYSYNALIVFVANKPAREVYII